MPHTPLRQRVADELDQLATRNTYDDSPDQHGLAGDIERLAKVVSLLGGEIDRLDDVELALLGVRELSPISAMQITHSGARGALDRLRERVVVRLQEQRADWSASLVRADERAAGDTATVRAACRRRQPLGGTDAQALEHALTITEVERDKAVHEKTLALAERDKAHTARAHADNDRDDAEIKLSLARQAIDARNQLLQIASLLLSDVGGDEPTSDERTIEGTRLRADLLLRLRDLPPWREDMTDAVLERKLDDARKQATAAYDFCVGVREGETFADAFVRRLGQARQEGRLEEETRTRPDPREHEVTKPGKENEG